MRKKLIEVALPLEAINIASAREKSIRHGHPSTLHLWWARRPLAAARAVIFSQMVDDPSSVPEEFSTDKEQAAERERLFEIIEELVKWENTTNELIVQSAREEIWRSWRRTCADNADHPQAADLFDPSKLPAFHDPFAGGGALPLEAHRLGLEAYASDLNPVAVLINKATIEIPPRFAGMPPINPDVRSKNDLFSREWHGAEGLAEDVRYYGQWMRDEAEKRIGYLYPKVGVTAEMAKGRPDLRPYVGRSLTVIAWLWARTVRSPNPAFSHVDVPLASSFLLSTKSGKEAYVEPVIEGDQYRFVVRIGKPKDAEAAENGTKLSRGANFRCLMSNTPIAGDHIKAEGTNGRMGSRLMAVVVEGDRGRIYLDPIAEMEAVARSAQPTWMPEGRFVENGTVFTPCLYGLKEWRHLFTLRQTVALGTLSELVQEAREQAARDALAAGLPDDGQPLAGAGVGVSGYSDAVAVYLAFLVDQIANHSSSICGWNFTNTQMRNVFARQAIPMTWDYAESNPFCDSSGSINNLMERQVKGFETLGCGVPGVATQADANTQMLSISKVVSTDPPYYDNVPYADLSDFFYVWLRKSLKGLLPDLFATLAVPKGEELVAASYRHGGREKAEAFFLNGMTKAMHRLAMQCHPAYPVTIYYAFKQAEVDSRGGSANTGWETFLEAIISAGFAIDGTWPIRTEKLGRTRGNQSNALASSIVLVCRPRAAGMPAGTRRDFLGVLKATLPEALKHLQRGNIAPVDLAQAAIGPGMGVFTSYAKVLDAGGEAVSVRDALALINETLDEALAEQEGDFDADSRWAVAWFEQSGFETGEFGVAETLSTAKNTKVSGMAAAGILTSKGGKVRLLSPQELKEDWEPTTDIRLSAWEVVHQLIRALSSGGETRAAGLLARLGSKAEPARELAYRLYTISERKKRAQEALSYNALVQSWPEIMRLARESGKTVDQQVELFG